MKCRFLREAVPLVFFLFFSLAAVNTALAAETRKEARLRQMHMMVEACRALNPDFAASSETIYAGWRQRHDVFLKSLIKRPAYQEELVQSVKDLQSSGAQQFCTDVLISQLDLSSQPLNPAFTSPEATWATFVAALRQADRAAAINCLYSPAWKDRLLQLADDDLRRMGNAVKELKMDWGDDEVQMGYIVLHSGKAGSITFMNVYGNWKIMEM